jgi:hypothetical protein
MPLGNVIGSPSLKNELISRWENQEANRWGKKTSSVAGVVDEANPPHESAQREEREFVAIGRGTPSPATEQNSNIGTRPNQRTRRTRSSIVSLLRFARHRTTLSRWVDDLVRYRRP